MKVWTVVVERDGLAPLRFEDQSGHRAFDRAHSLCELHGCQFTQDDKALTLTVHAGRYYARPDERIHPNLFHSIGCVCEVCSANYVRDSRDPRDGA